MARSIRPKLKLFAVQFIRYTAHPFFPLLYNSAFNSGTASIPYLIGIFECKYMLNIWPPCWSRDTSQLKRRSNNKLDLELQIIAKPTLKPSMGVPYFSNRAAPPVIHQGPERQSKLHGRPGHPSRGGQRSFYLIEIIIEASGIKLG